MEEAVPGGQGMQPAEVCPLEGPYVPAAQGLQEERVREEGELL